jgi:hypothetical protein
VGYRARRLLFTHPGRMVLVAMYSVAAVISIVTYTIMRAPLYGLGQVALTGFGLSWARWCLRRV